MCVYRLKKNNNKIKKRAKIIKIIKKQEKAAAAAARAARRRLFPERVASDPAAPESVCSARLVHRNEAPGPRRHRRSGRGGEEEEGGEGDTERRGYTARAAALSNALTIT